MTKIYAHIINLCLQRPVKLFQIRSKNTKQSVECIAIHIINTKTFREEKKPEKRKLEFSKRAGSDQCVFILCFLNGSNRCVTGGGMAMEGKDHFILFLTTPTCSKTLKQLIIVKSSPLHQVSVEVRSGTPSQC